MSKFVILHKRKTPRFHILYNGSDETNICNIHEKEGASLKYYPLFIYNQFKKLNLCKSYSDRVINHLMSILISIFISRYHGKITDFTKNSSCHRTTIAHFLNSREWDGSLLSDTLKQSVIEIIYSEAVHTRKPVFYIVDATIVSKTKPSSRALHTIEDAYFHQSLLKKKTRLWTSGSCCHAFLQWHCPERPYLHRRSFPVMWAAGQSKCSFASVRINWHGTAIKCALHKESKGISCLCHWHIFSDLLIYSITY